MICEKCGSKDVKTVETRHNDESYETYRQKVCRGCGRTFYTLEFEIEPDADFMDSWCSNYRKKAKKPEESDKYARDVEVPSIFKPAEIGDKVRIVEYKNAYSFVDKNEVVTVGRVYGNRAIGVHYSEFKHFPEYRESVLKECDRIGIPYNVREEVIIPEDEHFRFLMFDYIILDNQK